MNIVSFTGPKGSGKDTAAAILAEAGLSQGKISFAGPMKEILSRVLAIPLETFESPQLKEKPFACPITLTPTIFEEIYLEMQCLLPDDEFSYPQEIEFVSENVDLLFPRHALQVIGTDIIRNKIGPDWHVAAAFRNEVVKKLDPNGLYCVTDARFPNEYTWLRRRFKDDFVGFYVNRPAAEQTLETATHASELSVKEVRRMIPVYNVLDNSGPVEALQSELLYRFKL